jgi:hypothetical protein
MSTPKLSRGIYAAEMVPTFDPFELVNLGMWLGSHGTPHATPADHEQRLGAAGDVLFIDDLARLLQCGRSTIERRRRSGSFPIPELPAVDARPRWSRQAVERYLASTSGGFSARRGRRRRVLT